METVGAAWESKMTKEDQESSSTKRGWSMTHFLTAHNQESREEKEQ